MEKLMNVSWGNYSIPSDSTLSSKCEKHVYEKQVEYACWTSAIAYYFSVMKCTEGRCKGLRGKRNSNSTFGNYPSTHLEAETITTGPEAWGFHPWSYDRVLCGFKAFAKPIWHHHMSITKCTQTATWGSFCMSREGCSGHCPRKAREVVYGGREEAAFQSVLTSLTPRSTRKARESGPVLEFPESYANKS